MLIIARNLERHATSAGMNDDLMSDLHFQPDTRNEGEGPCQPDALGPEQRGSQL